MNDPNSGDWNCQLCGTIENENKDEIGTYELCEYCLMYFVNAQKNKVPKFVPEWECDCCKYTNEESKKVVGIYELCKECYESIYKEVEKCYESNELYLPSM